MISMKKVRLECTTGGSGKWYEMEHNKHTGCITATWGPMGKPARGSAVYNDYEWDKKYNEKIRKGYMEVKKSTGKGKTVSNIKEWFEKIDSETPIAAPPPKVQKVVKAKVIANGSVGGFGFAINHLHKIGDEGIMTDVDKKYGTCNITINDLIQEVSLKDVKVIKD